MSATSTVDDGGGRPAESARRLEAACDAFERAWATGGSPQVEDYLAGWDEPGRSDLRRELIRLELYHRRRRGDICRADDYRARFPDLAPDWLAAALAGDTAGSLSGSGRAAATLPGPDPTGGPAAPASDLDPLPRAFGDYELLEVLGRGGMGVVCKARQLSLGRTVALKLIRTGQLASPAELRRFRSEVEAIAHLDHPGVVPISEFGERDGLPYFTMKLIDGGSLARRMAEYRLPGPGPGGPVGDRQAAAARLVAATARAVHHTHQRGVLHRDLKPGNILIDRHGAPHVSDFGLAKRMEGDASLTGAGEPVGTASYMSPEQARGDRLLTTATDVYGLGAVLYELLAGRPPFRGANLVETLRLVQEADVEPPRRRQPRVDRDLEAVCLKCLEKDPARRYASAEALADDLERFLRHQPVLAGPAGAGARLRKFVRRHKGPVLAAALVLLALGGGLAGTTAGMLRAWAAEQQAAADRDEALKQKRRARQALDTMISQEMIEPLWSQKELTAGQQAFLKTALGYYKEFAAEAATGEEGRKLEADAHFRVGSLLMSLGRRPEAAAAFTAAQAAYARLADDFPANPDYGRGLAASHYNLGSLFRGLGKWTEAEAAHRAALVAQEKLAADFPAVAQYRRDVAQGHHGLGNLYADLGRRPEAEAAYRAALAVRAKLADDFPAAPQYREDLATSQNGLGRLLATVGRWAEAEAAYRAALAVRAKLADDFPAVAQYRHALAQSHGNLTSLLADLGKWAEAEAACRAALALLDRLAIDFPAAPQYREDLANAHNSLAIGFVRQRRWAEAEAAYRAALAVLEKLTADYPAVPKYRNDLARGHNNLGMLLDSLGRRPPAQAAYRAALAVQEKLAADHPTVPEYQIHLGSFYCNQGRMALDDDLPAALGWYQKAVDCLHPAVDREPRAVSARQWLLNGYVGRALALAKLRRPAEALLDVDRALAADGGADREAARLGRTRLYDCACVLSLAAAAGHPDGERRAARAVALLRQSFARGYLNVSHMLRDDDLVPLRPRADYVALLWDLADAPAPKP